MKYDEETEEGRQRDVIMERNKVVTNKEVTMAYHYLMKKLNKYNIVLFYKI